MAEKEQCFVIMPFSSRSGSEYGKGHFQEVFEELFEHAIEQAGFEPFRADTKELSRHILSDLFNNIEKAPIVLCDLSDANPNVLFELGWAFRADRPCVLVMDDLTTYPFDLQHNHVTRYRSSLKSREVREDTEAIRNLIQNTSKDTTRRWSLLQSLGVNARLQMDAMGQDDLIPKALLQVLDELTLLRERIDQPTDIPKSPEIDNPMFPRWVREDDVAPKLVRGVLQAVGWNTKRAADTLSISQDLLRELMLAHGIRPITKRIKRIRPL